MSHPAAQSILKSLIWSLVSALGFSVMSFFIKKIGNQVSNFEIVFFRGFINLIFVSVIMIFRKESFYPKTGKPLLLLRSLAGFGGACCLFYTLVHLPLPIATIINWSSPLFVITFSRFFLGEKVNAQTVFWAFVAIVGLWFALEGLSFAQIATIDQGFLFATGIGFLGALLGGTAYLAVRAATARFSVNLIIFYFTAITTILSFLVLLLNEFNGLSLGSPFFLNQEILINLIGVGLSATLGQYGLTFAYQNSQASLVSLMGLFNPIFTSLMSVYVFKEILKSSQWFGIALVLVGVAFVAQNTNNLIKGSAKINAMS